MPVGLLVKSLLIEFRVDVLQVLVALGRGWI
jgi:hypothetical protein